MMDTLFDLDTVPTKADMPAQERPQYKYYVRGRFHAGGEMMVLWKLHSNGGAEYFAEAEMGHKRPHFYKTLDGARRAAKEWGGEVVGWKVGEQS